MASIFAKVAQASSLITAVKGLVTIPKRTVIHNVIIDCVHSEVIDYSNQITEHPISTKAAIADHVFKQPVIINIEGTITDSNFRIFGVIEQPLQANSIQKLLSNAKQLFSLDIQKPSEVAFKALTTLADEKALISVATKYKVYDKMVIEKLSIKNDATTAHRLLFSCTLRQLTIVKVASAAYTPKTPLRSVGKAVEKGQQQITEQQPVNKSIIAKGVDLLMQGIKSAKDLMEQGY